MSTSRFHDGQHGTTHLVRLLLFGRELRIVGANDATLARWPVDRLRAAPERDPDGAVAVTARDQPGVLLVDDGQELAKLREAGLRPPNHRAWNGRRWIAVCLGLLATVGCGLLALNDLPRRVAVAIPVAWEQRLGQSVEALMTGSLRHCSGEDGQAAIDHLVAVLRAAGGVRPPVSVAVIDSPIVNAFALPGGHVLVMRGLIATADDGPMLAGVIAHELGHVAHRDATTRMLRALGTSMLLNLLGFGDAGATAAAGASNLMTLAYGRAAEAAADATAIDLLTRAGLRADGLSRFFVVMERRAGGTPDAPEKPANGPRTMGSWFASHPPTEARRESTARAATGQPPFTDAEWRGIKTMCAGR